MEPRLYGFDARVGLGAGDPWPVDRRERYLLRPEIEQPLSVDARVWPLVAAARPTDGYMPDVWFDLAAIKRACAAEPRVPTAIIALAVLDDHECVQATHDFGSVTCAIDLAWLPLGWDIVDGDISGLSNCGYNPDEDPGAARATFGRQLNAHGLFDDLSGAQAFRAETARRVPEHAPFTLHRLYLVESIPAE